MPGLVTTASLCRGKNQVSGVQGLFQMFSLGPSLLFPLGPSTDRAQPLSWQTRAHVLSAYFLCTMRVCCTRRVTMHRALSAASCAVLLFLSLTGPKLALAEGDLQRVNHIIIVMQENHSFDNYFGVLAYTPGSPYHNANGACLPSDHHCVDGLSCVADVSGNLTCSNSNLDDDGSTVVAFHDSTRCVIPDLDHSWFGTHTEVNFLSPNSTLRSFLSDGFVTVNDLTEQLDSRTDNPSDHQTMGFYNQNDIPFYYDLAQKFAINDRYFASVLVPTFPNRAYLLAATSFGHVTTADEFPPPGGYKPTTATTFALLTQKAISYPPHFHACPTL